MRRKTVNKLCLSLLACLACLKCVANDEVLPSTKEELAKWIVGTEWLDRFDYKNKKNEKGLVRRFEANGVMLFQKKTKKWKDDNYVYKGKYQILSGNTIQFGPYKWAVVFSEDFKKYKGKSQKKNGRVFGKFVKRY